MLIKQVYKALKGNALGLRARCVSLASQGKGEPQSPWPVSRPNHLLHDGPNEAAAQNNGGHHQQVEVDQVEVLSGGRGLGVTRAPSAHIGFSCTTISPCPVLSTETVPIL